MSNDEQHRRELAGFLRSRRERVSPTELDLPVGPRRRTQGLRREEVAVLAGVSPTWYTYLEQARKIQPSAEVLDAIARVLSLDEDERRYMHMLALGHIAQPRALSPSDHTPALLEDIMGAFANIPSPIYAANRYCDLLCWNHAFSEWYPDLTARPSERRNLMDWMLSSPAAKETLLDHRDQLEDLISRWRSEAAKWPNDDRLTRMIQSMEALSSDFKLIWGDYPIREHRSAIRRIKHPNQGILQFKAIPLNNPELTEILIVLYLWDRTSNTTIEPSTP